MPPRLGLSAREQLFDVCLKVSDLSLPIVGYVVDVPGEEAEYIDQRNQRTYSNVWSLLNVAITTRDDAVPFFTDWRVFQFTLLTLSASTSFVWSGSSLMTTSNG